MFILFCVFGYLALVTASASSAAGSTDNDRKVQELVELALQAIDAAAFDESERDLLQATTLNKDDYSVNRVLGYVYVKTSNIERGLQYMENALNINEWKYDIDIANYVESLRKNNRQTDASRICLQYVYSVELTGRLLPFNCAVVAKSLQRYDLAVELFSRAVELDLTHTPSWYELIVLLLDPLRRLDLAEANIDTLVASNLANEEIYGLQGDLYFLFLYDYDKAIAAYKQALSVKPQFKKGKVGLAAALQLNGRLQESRAVYESMLPFSDDDAALMNNYGTLLGLLGIEEDRNYWLKRAAQISPNSSIQLINLAVEQEENGHYLEAARYYDLAIKADGSRSPSLLLKSILMFPAVYESWDDLVRKRGSVEQQLRQLVYNWTVYPPGKETMNYNHLDSIHFYLVYHGFNDRSVQQTVGEAYRLCLEGVEDVVQTTKLQTDGSITIAKPFKIGFLSKYFYEHEPHGLLLEGVLKYLPKHQFLKYLLPVVGNGHKPILPALIQFSDFLVSLPLKHEAALKLVVSLNLDVLLFADTMTEPMAHFLSMGRLAPIQLAFWGSPVTSCSANIDYFVSADELEHPYRTRLLSNEEPYNEQVVMLDGQGVYYSKPTAEESPEAKTHGDQSAVRLKRHELLGISDHDAFLFFCPQSVFKMHPLFDNVFRQILLRTKSAPSTHIVVTSGRKEAWTRIYKTRLINFLGGVNSSLAARLHFIPRVRSEQFIDLLKLADVVLHPFPFDGSRTAADSLLAGVPYITLPSEYLRGRMGKTFYKTMNLPQLVAHDMEEYIAVAVQLATDSAFLQKVRRLIAESSHLIWDDLDTAYSWTTFLSSVVGEWPTLTWEKFLEINGRDSNLENTRKDLISSNRALFEQIWGNERHLLDSSSNLATLQASTEVPRIFNNWKTSATLNIAWTALQESQEPPPTVAIRQINDINHVPTSSSIQTAGSRNLFTRGRHGTGHRSLTMQSEGGYETVEVPVPSELVGAFAELRQSGSLDAVYDALAPLEAHYEGNLLFHLEYGALQYFRGSYESAYRHCSAVVHALCTSNSSSGSRRAYTYKQKPIPHIPLPYACLGASAVYLRKYDDAVNNLLTAYRLMRSNPAYNHATERNDDYAEFRSSMFAITEDAVHFNLLMTYFTFERHKECVDYVLDVMNLPPLVPSSDSLKAIQHGVDMASIFVLSVASVNWTSPHALRLLRQKEHEWKRTGKILNASFNVMENVYRIQRDYSSLFTSAMHCFDKENLLNQSFHIELAAAVARPLDDAYVKYMASIMQEAEVDLQSPRRSNRFREEYKRSGIALITQHFSVSDPAVKAAFKYALQQNLQNPAISVVVLLNQHEQNLFNYQEFNYSWKLTIYTIGKRLAYTDAFVFANQYLRGRAVALGT
jgi:protein O-GlcNAc transferase